MRRSRRGRRVLKDTVRDHKDLEKLLPPPAVVGRTEGCFLSSTRVSRMAAE